MIKLEETYRRSNIPLYLQVASTLKRRIETGYWKFGEKISTIEELEVEFQVARVTIRQAFDQLRKEGLVRIQQGRGTFVAKQNVNKRWLRLEISLDSFLDSIVDNIPNFLEVVSPPRVPRLDADDGEAADDYIYLKSVQTKDDEPYGVVSVHLARSVYDLAPEEFGSHTALPVLSNLDCIEIGRAHQTLGIGSADMETAHLLDLPLNAPTAEVHCVVNDTQNTAIYVTEIIYRGDCIKFDIEFLQYMSTKNQISNKG